MDYGSLTTLENRVWQKRWGHRLFIDGRTVERDSTIEVDICVIGAGAAGITLGLQFLSRGPTVALVESGGLSWDERTQDLADFEVDGPKYFIPKQTRVRVFGGTTNIWGGVCTPMDPMDFEPRPWVPNSGWPISSNSVKPYFGRALELCGAARPGCSPEDRARSTHGVKWTRLYFSPPARFARRYGNAFRVSGNVRSFLHSSVTELDLHPDGQRIQCAKIACAGGNRFKVQARFFVLAGGGIENARLLLVSNGIAKTGIGNEHDVVGRYAMEHPRVMTRYRLPGEANVFESLVPNSFGMIRFSRLQLTEETQRSERLLNYQANISFGYLGQNSDQWKALQRVFFAIRHSESAYFPHITGGRNRIRWSDLRTILKRPDRTFLGSVGAVMRPARLRKWCEVVSTVEQPPLQRNRVTLSAKRDRFGKPLAKMTWSISESEEHTFRRGLELVLEKLDAMMNGIRNSRIDEPDPWPQDIVGTWHHMGTTRMSNDRRRGVVDEHCRVHGLANLYIAGSSVFPTGGVHSPTVTLVALTLRLVDHFDSLLGE